MARYRVVTSYETPSTIDVEADSFHIEASGALLFYDRPVDFDAPTAHPLAPFAWPCKMALSPTAWITVDEVNDGA